MKNMNSKINKISRWVVCASLFTIHCSLFTSCVDTVILPDNKTIDEDFWQKKADVEGVVAAAYAQLRSDEVVCNMIVWGDFRSDEMVMAEVPVSAEFKIALSQIYSMNIDTENAFTKWAPFYSAINYCNLVLEKAEEVIAIDPDYSRGDYDANKAQVLALRAFCYFYLTRVFHDIPVTPAAYLNSSDDLNAPQESPAEVIDMCINDLQEALRVAVSGSTFGDWRDKGYFNKDGINALLADIYLWRASVNRDVNDYQKCVDHCDLVIQAKKAAYEQNPPKTFGSSATPTVSDYYLSTYDDMYDDLFGQNGQNAIESIFELQYRTSSSTNNGMNYMYYRYKGETKNTNGYLKAATIYGKVDGTGKSVWHNDVDQRLYDYIYDAKSTSLEQFGVRKFVAATWAGKGTVDTRTSSPSLQKDWIIYRLTDVMLMKAEALVQLYELNGKATTDTRNQDAFEICKFVNDRALPDDAKPASSLKYTVYKDKMEDLVLAERVRELCFEGKRWFDLMRYNYRHTTQQADLTKKLSESYVTNSSEFFELALRKYAVPGAMKGKIRDERYLYMPINQDEIEVNPNLVQNPAYKSSAKY